ncbi:MAG: hypothetical protein ACXU82_00445 [Caulobacteraceae bacterium]
MLSDRLRAAYPTLSPSGLAHGAEDLEDLAAQRGGRDHGCRDDHKALDQQRLDQGYGRLLDAHRWKARGEAGFLLHVMLDVAVSVRIKGAPWKPSVAGSSPPGSLAPTRIKCSRRACGRPAAHHPRS